MKSCVQNGRVINPATGFDQLADLCFEEGVITGIYAPGTAPACAEIIDAAGCWVTPGLIDLHVHFREPGLTHKESIETGALAAAAGGFTTVCMMPNTIPTVDTPAVLEQINAQAKKACGVKLLTVGAITGGLAGETLNQYAAMEAAGGLCALSEDGKSVMNSRLLREAMELAHLLELPVFSHCEDKELAAGGAMRQGEISEKLGIPGIPAETEAIVVIRDILLAQATGCQLHLCHISTRESIALIRWAKSQGIVVTAETGPHYFTLCDQDVARTQSANFKMNPPLAAHADMEAVKAALADGTIDVIATDHAPHHKDEKDKPFAQAPFGVIGLETSFAVSNSTLVQTGILTPLALIDAMSHKPARILGLDAGNLSAGKPADITILNPDTQWVVEPEQFFSKARNCPFAGQTVTGQVQRTIVGGMTIFQKTGS